GNLGPSAAHRIHIAITQRPAHGRGTDKRRVADNVIRLRPLSLFWITVDISLDLCGFIRHLFASNRADSGGDAVPAGKWFPAGVGQQLLRVITDQRIAVFYILEITQYRLRWADLAVGAVVPLQITNPQHHLGNA